MYKFDEDKYISELKDYVDKTYNQHYAGNNKIQTMEILIDRNRALDFCLGNIDKYSNRYGFKGNAKDQRNDILKILHYAILLLYVHDKKNDAGVHEIDN